ncbi:MAG: nitrite/sulfite reductase [Brevinematales bacterium]|nr:nitrite/sulfite reductase [Brevinematales bacterium]
MVEDYIDIFDIHKGADIESEIRELEAVINRFLSGNMSPEKFLSFRLMHGIYGVRHYPEGMHMIRIKLPQGIINSNQLRAVATMVERYAGSGVAHITTRQDLQLHYVKLEDIPSLFRDMARVSLTSKEACGNTVRNITASPFTGISKDEIFDVLPYAMYMTRYFLRHPLTLTLPRKFKIAWSESEKDWGMVRIHDLGFIAQKKVIDGKETKGFKVYVGGGLGAIPMPAYVLTDFVDTENVYYLSEAVIRVFHREGERKLRSKARIKFLVAKLGIDEFRSRVFEEYERVRRHINIKDDLENYISNFPHPAPFVNGREGGKKVQNIDYSFVSEYRSLKTTPEYSNWFANDVCEQRQEGYNAVFIRIALGNLKPDDLRNIARMSEDFGAGYVVMTQRQDILLPWVRYEFLPAVFGKLKEYGLLADSTLPLITSCPGAYSCKLAVTYPYNLAETISKEINDLMGIRINISGCPNSCGQHHIGDIGFSGNSLNSSDGTIPFYLMYLGGYPYEENTIIGNAVLKIPSKRVPMAVKRILEIYKSNRNDGESFRDFLKRFDIEVIKREISPLTKVNPKSEDPELYRDWGQNKDFVLEAAKRGECAGSLLDIISISIFESLREVYEAEEYLQDEDFSTVVQKSFNAVLGCMKALLYLKGLDLSTPEEIIDNYKNLIIPDRILPREYDSITEDVIEWIKNVNKIDKYKANEVLNKVSLFVRDVDKAFLRLTPELKIEALRNSGEDDEKMG